MDRSEFLHFRKMLNKTQKQMGQLVGTSVKAIHSYEQGWRSIPVHVERQVFFLVSRRRGLQKEIEPCWVTKKCPPERRERCPAWEFKAGTLCWFINGTICEGLTHDNGERKTNLCRRCEVLSPLLDLQEKDSDPLS